MMYAGGIVLLSAESESRSDRSEWTPNRLGNPCTYRCGPLLLRIT